MCISILYWSLPFWLTSLCIMGSSFIHLIRTDSNVFFSMAEWYSVVYMYHSFLIHSSADGHLGWVHVLAIINSSTTYLKDNLFYHWLFLVPFPNIHWPYLVVQSLSCVQLFVAHWTTAHQASLSFTISQSLLKPMCIVSDATQPSHPLLSPSPLAFNLSQHQGLFQWVGSSHQVAKLLEF